MKKYRSITIPTITTIDTIPTIPTISLCNIGNCGAHGMYGSSGSTSMDIPCDHPYLRAKTGRGYGTISIFYTRGGLIKSRISRAYIDRLINPNRFPYLLSLLLFDYTIHGSLYLFRPEWFIAETKYGWISCLLKAIRISQVMIDPPQPASRTQIEKDKDIDKGIEFNRNSGFSIAGRVNDELKVNSYISIIVDNESTDTTVVPRGRTLTIDNGASVDILLTQFFHYFPKISN